VVAAAGPAAVSFSLVKSLAVKASQRNIARNNMSIDRNNSSAFPLKLLLAYIVLIGLIPTFQFFSDFGNIEATETDWDWSLGWSLILCVPLALAICLAGHQLKKMWVFGGLVIFFSGWHIVTTLFLYFNEGLLPSPYSEMDLQPLYFLRAALIVSLPFFAIYYCWYLWRAWRQRLS
jgi:hypothetical protein